MIELIPLVRPGEVVEDDYPSLNEIYGKHSGFEYLINSFDFVGEMNRLLDQPRDTRPIRLGGGRKKHRVASPAKRSKRKAQNAARKRNK